MMDGTILRLPIPRTERGAAPGTGQGRRAVCRAARVAVRNVRRDGMDQLKKAKAAGMAEDDQKLWHDEIQDLTDEAIAQSTRR